MLFKMISSSTSEEAFPGSLSKFSFDVKLWCLAGAHQFGVIRLYNFLIDCQIWLKLPRVPGNFKPGWNFLRLYISVLGLLELGGGSAMCTDIHTNVHVCRSRWNVHVCIGRECSSATVICYMERKIILSIVCIQRSLPSRKALWKYIF